MTTPACGNPRPHDRHNDWHSTGAYDYECEGTPPAATTAAAGRRPAPRCERGAVAHHGHWTPRTQTQSSRWCSGRKDISGGAMSGLLDHFGVQHDGLTVPGDDQPDQRDQRDGVVTRDLPWCGECGGTYHHTSHCSAYDPAKVLSVSGGWCRPADAEPEQAASARRRLAERFAAEAQRFADLDQPIAAAAVLACAQQVADLFGGTDASQEAAETPVG